MSGIGGLVLEMLRPMAIAAALIVVPLTEAQAQTVREGAQPGRAVVILANGTTFDWHRKKAPRATANIATAPSRYLPTGARLGRGSYVCSPAGFGRRSHCFSR
jgi:hypothetical protein